MYVVELLRDKLNAFLLEVLERLKLWRLSSRVRMYLYSSSVEVLGLCLAL